MRAFDITVADFACLRNASRFRGSGIAETRVAGVVKRLGSRQSQPLWHRRQSLGYQNLPWSGPTSPRGPTHVANEHVRDRLMVRRLLTWPVGHFLPERVIPVTGLEDGHESLLCHGTEKRRSILESDGRPFAFSYYNLLNIEQHSIKQA